MGMTIYMYNEWYVKKMLFGGVVKVRKPNYEKWPRLKEHVSDIFLDEENIRSRVQHLSAPLRPSGLGVILSGYALPLPAFEPRRA